MTSDGINVLTILFDFISNLLQTNIPGTTISFFTLFFGLVLFKAMMWLLHNIFNINPDTKGGLNNGNGIKH